MSLLACLHAKHTIKISEMCGEAQKNKKFLVIFIHDKILFLDGMDKSISTWSEVCFKPTS